MSQSAVPTPHTAAGPIAPAVVTLHVWGVPTRQIPASMGRVGRDRLSLRGYPGLQFAKLLGTGSGSTFAPQHADPHHWALLACWDAPHAAETFERSRVVRRWDAAASERLRLTMKPMTSTGQWSGREPFGPEVTHESSNTATTPVATLTRARIRLSQNRAFWKALPDVVAPLPTQPGLMLSLAIGEAPIGFQGTFSVWSDLAAMKAFAYQTPGHRAAIADAHKHDWFAEELFARFHVVAADGTFMGEQVTLT